MRVDTLRHRVASALEAAMRSRDPDAIALTADRAKAMGIALAGMPQEADVDPRRLTVSTRSAAAVLGFHPEHVRRLVRQGRLGATREGGNLRLALADLWPLLEARHREPGGRRGPTR